MHKAPQDFIQLGHTIGTQIPFWVQGAGGNISVKVGDQMWIKASGARLDQIEKTASQALINFKPALRDFHQLIAALDGDANENDLEKKYSEIIQKNAIPMEGFGRPSMETGFHVFLPEKWVVHFHALSALIMAHESDFKPQKWKEWLAQKKITSLQIIDAIRPGLRLSASLQSVRDQSIFILKNHGVILQGEDLSILETWKKIELEFLDDFGYPELADLISKKEGLNLSLDFVSSAPEGKLNIYFPDTAVFVDELQKFLTHVSGKFKAPPKSIQELSTKELGLLEIWFATRTLNILVPELEELPETISQTVASLPTEAYRKEKAQ